ncbi:MAG: SCO family protein, partial [Acetobacteraceae bacterium]
GQAPAPNDGIVSMRGRLQPLAFTMTLASTGQKVTAAHFRSDAVILYFGFTRCPDTCALTAYNAARLMSLLGKDAARTRFLFVTIDLAHDTVPILRNYLAEYGPPPGIDGLRGTPAELRGLAKRYFVYYRAPTNPNSPDPVSTIAHQSAVYLFGPGGKAEAIVSTLGEGDAPLDAIAGRIESLLGAHDPQATHSSRGTLVGAIKSAF